MAERKMKVRTRPQDGAVEVLMLVTHPMETGQRVDKKTNQKIPGAFHPAHHAGAQRQGSSGRRYRRRYLRRSAARFSPEERQKGDKVKLSWSDNKGESGSAETVVDV